MKNVQRFTIDEIVDLYGNQLTEKGKEDLRIQLAREKARQTEGMTFWKKLWFVLRPIFKELLLTFAEAFVNKNKK